MRTHCITIDLANQGRRQVRARFDGGRMSSDGGALLLQAVDQRIGLTRRLFGLALGYEDLCDHDRLRGDNQRFVVTSLERGRIGTQPLYEQLYCARGDMENRIKEQQLDLFADRTSAATRRANQLRLYWALFAAALREVLRQRGLAGTELARAQCGTIRALLLKVAAVVRVSGRRVWVSLSSVFPRQELFAHSLARLRAETPG